MAKCGMENMRMMNTWRGWRHIYGEKEWSNISAKAMRKDAMRKAMVLTHAEWEAEKEKMITASNAPEPKKSLSLHLAQWDIKKHWIYKKERMHLRWKDWAVLSKFRTGHSNLNDQRKYGRADNRCDECEHNAAETMTHFLFDCEGFSEPRREWMTAMRRLLTAVEWQGWAAKSGTNKLRFVLFPYQRQLRGCKEEEKEVLILKRIQIIREFAEFTRRTKRWKEYEDRTYIQL